MDDPVNAVGMNLRRLRARRQLTTAELARKSGVARATLTALESGRGNPTLDTLYALAKVLDASLADLIVDVRAPRARVVRAGEGSWVGGSAVDGRLLDHLDPHLRTDLYELVIRAGAPRHSEPHQAGVVECFVLQEGRVRIGPREEPVELAAGDFVRFPADVPHLYEALGDDARGLLVIQTPFGAPERKEDVRWTGEKRSSR
ncbi:XRE family transcriptional regulator [Streptomyces litchfieldiae]|uniref:XRE family transcriptional regulator n=1 Tax=Streptomyces litchfieldiae TaxID=3075543 RepID=A0ABU2MJ69_9ACTN|nr:XRE family transcriptional regulator [Streptomyces sp. DSM 44938]MDT0341646.1 XRE family transcriptional regulator [Streptomyces sp. DSM 44938]